MFGFQPISVLGLDHLVWAWTMGVSLVSILPISDSGLGFLGTGVFLALLRDVMCQNPCSKKKKN